MRVVAGEAGGRRLAAPPGRATRPTSDQVREAIFNSLTSLTEVRGATVVDLFAGSGALGIEALSRGATHATFVESDRRALAVIRENLATVGFGDRARVVHGDVLREVGAVGAVDLALIDPPYAFDGWRDLTERLQAGVAVLETDRELGANDLGAGWDIPKSKRYGGTVVTFIRRPEDPQRS